MIISIILISLGSLNPVLALGSDSEVEVYLSPELPEAQKTLKEKEIKMLLEQAGQALEPKAEFKGMLREYLIKLNFKSIALQARRWIDLHQGGLMGKTSADIATLFLLSHPIEMLSGPAFLVLGNAYQLPAWATGLGTAIGGIISIPGLDPLCLVIFFTYAKSKNFRTWVGKFRVGVVRAGAAAGKALGLPALLSHLLKEKDSYQSLMDRINEKQVREKTWTWQIELDRLPSKTQIVVREGVQELLLEFFIEEGRDFLGSMVGDRTLIETLDSKVSSQLRSSFGWNLGNLLKEMAKLTRQSDYPSRFYVSRVERGPKMIAVDFVPKAIQLSRSWEWQPDFRPASLRCQSLVLSPHFFRVGI